MDNLFKEANDCRIKNSPAQENDELLTEGWNGETTGVRLGSRNNNGFSLSIT